jgi:hypothetical protein
MYCTRLYHMFETMVVYSGVGCSDGGGRGRRRRGYYLVGMLRPYVGGGGGGGDGEVVYGVDGEVPEPFRGSGGGEVGFRKVPAVPTSFVAQRGRFC